MEGIQKTTREILKLDHTEFYLGEIKKGELVIVNVTGTNAVNQDLQYKKVPMSGDINYFHVHVTCGCTTPPEDFLIEANNTFSFPVTIKKVSLGAYTVTFFLTSELEEFRQSEKVVVRFEIVE